MCVIGFSTGEETRQIIEGCMATRIAVSRMFVALETGVETNLSEEF
jgi:hypothetical protein